MCLLATSAAFAEEVTSLNKDVMEGNTNVSLTIDPEDNSFVVVIPASVTVDPETKEGYMDIVLQAGWKLPSANGLNVRIKEFANGPKANHAPNSDSPTEFLTMKNAEESIAKYAISLKAVGKDTYTKLYNWFDTGATPDTTRYWKQRNLIHVERDDSNTEDLTANLMLYVPELPTDPGEYTDTITFVINLE